MDDESGDDDRDDLTSEVSRDITGEADGMNLGRQAGIGVIAGNTV